MKFWSYVLQTTLETIQVLFWIAVALSVLFGAICLLIWHTVFGSILLVIAMILAVSYGRYLNDQDKKNKQS